MDGLIAAQRIVEFLPLVAAGLVLVLVLVRVRGVARPIGVAGAVLLLLGSLQPVAHPIVQRFTPEPSMPPVVLPAVPAMISVIAVLLLAAGVLLTSYAIGTGSRTQRTP